MLLHPPLELTSSPRNLTVVDLAPRVPSLLGEVLSGLSLPRKSLPPKLFYDAVGAQLFNAICATSAYYVTRTEDAILRSHADEISAAIGQGATIVEPGAGDMRKIRVLLRLLRPRLYAPVDISAVQLAVAAEALALEFPWLRVMAIAADFRSPDLAHMASLGDGRRVMFFPGSTIGNFEPGQAVEFLRDARALIGDEGRILMGVDLRKSKARLELAYNDPEGWTARFNLNMLVRINRDMDADFDTDAFAHRAYYNEDAGRIEMHLVSIRTQWVTIAGRRFSFQRGETIHTENSYKYVPEGFLALAREAGVGLQKMWTDEAGWFGVFCLAPS
jgi:dimethylhistidine N-methyltransferase